MEDLKAIRKRVSELRKKISGMPISKASVEDLKAEIAHHEAGMKAIMRKQLLAEKKNGIEVVAFPDSEKKTPLPESQKKTTLPKKSPAKPKKVKKVPTIETPSDTEESVTKLEPKVVAKKSKMLVKITKDEPMEESAMKTTNPPPEKMWGKNHRIIGL